MSTPTTRDSWRHRSIIIGTLLFLSLLTLIIFSLRNGPSFDIASIEHTHYERTGSIVEINPALQFLTLEVPSPYRLGEQQRVRVYVDDETRVFAVAPQIQGGAAYVNRAASSSLSALRVNMPVTVYFISSGSRFLAERITYVGDGTPNEQKVPR